MMNTGSACAIVGGSGAIGSALAGCLPADVEPVIIDVRPPATAGSLHLDCDIRDEQQVRDTFVTLRDRGIQVRWLVNCAGRFGASQRPPVDLAPFWDVMSLHAAGPLTCAMQWYELFGRSHGGMIINITSASAVRASRDTAYAASKAALEAISRSLARHFAPAGVTVLAVAPGTLNSPMSESLPAAQRAGLREATFSGADATPDALARLICALMLCPGSSLLSGQVVRADDGLSIPR